MGIFRSTGQRVGAVLGAATLTAAVLIGYQVVDEGGVDVTLACPVAEQHVPDGPDGMGGCWPGPETTGPSVTPTVVYTPEPSPGDRYVFNSPITIENRVFNADILVASPDVVIKDSIITGNIEVYETGSVHFIDSKIDAGNWVAAAAGGWNIDLTRTEILGGGQALICSGGCNWVDVYSHSPYYFEDQDAHQSAFATTGNMSGVSISAEHSVLWCSVPQISPLGGGCTSNVALQPNFAPIENVTITRNLLPAIPTGSYCLTGGYASAEYNEFGPMANNIVITDNVFGKGENGKCGVFGSSSGWNPAGTGNVWSGNTFTDGTPVTPNT